MLGEESPMQLGKIGCRTLYKCKIGHKTPYNCGVADGHSSFMEIGHGTPQHM
uniref:Uncharacterized protein n=1 Tax=Arundo donax TaxID=35708 RepID=A0A0A9G017_ARUDO